MKVAYEGNRPGARWKDETSSRYPSGEQKGAEGKDYKARVGRQADRELLKGCHILWRGGIERRTSVEAHLKSARLKEGRDLLVGRERSRA